MKFILGSEIRSALDYKSLVTALEGAFQKEFNVPKRHHHDYPNPPNERDSTLLLMPAWEAGGKLGVKIVTVSPENASQGLPSIHGTYLLIDAKNGVPLAIMEANTLTTMRTAATSALASKFLSREDCSSMLMIGTGALAPELIHAHCLVRPGIRNVYVWGRSPEKTRAIVENTRIRNVVLSAIDTIEEIISDVDLVSSATLSSDPLIHGNLITAGQHIDLVGSYRPDMREADDAVIKRSEVFVDTYEGAPNESGDIAIPLNKKLITMEDVRGDLAGLCKGKVTGRRNAEQITLFKSVGHAIEDLAAAELVYKVIASQK